MEERIIMEEREDDVELLSEITGEVSDKLEEAQASLDWIESQISGSEVIGSKERAEFQEFCRRRPAVSDCLSEIQEGVDLAATAIGNIREALEQLQAIVKKPELRAVAR